MKKTTIIKHRLTIGDDVEVMFIVKNNKVLYINHYADFLFTEDRDGDFLLDGRIVKIVYKSLFGSVSVFVAFNKEESFNLFTLNIERDKRLHYVAMEIINFVKNNGINKKLNFNLGIFFTCYSAYKLYKKNQKYYMVNNSRNDAYIIGDDVYKNSSNIDPLIDEFFNNINNNNISNSHSNANTYGSFPSISQSIFDDTFSHIQKYGFEDIALSYAMLVDNQFSDDMELRFKQMMQFIREDADAARLSDIEEIRNFGLEIFRKEDAYIYAMNEKLKFGIDDDGGPQEIMTTVLFSLLRNNYKLAVLLRVQIVKFLVIFYNLYQKVYKEYKPSTHTECINILLTKYKEENQIFVRGVYILNLLTKEYNSDD